MIKVAYSGLNYGDIKGMTMLPSITRPKNSIPAMDYSGTIVARGSSAPSYLTVGTRVFGVLGTHAIFTGEGTLCDYICLSTKQHLVAPVPENCTLEQAGCIAIGGTMAYRICKFGSIQPDCRLRMLVNGASGGCGSIFLQAAKAMGAREIVATCSSRNFELVKSLGADAAIDYREKAPLHEYLAQQYGEKKFDIIVDTVGAQDLYTHSPGYLKEDGPFVNIGDFTNGTWRTALHWFLNLFWPTWLGGTPRRYVMFGPGFDTVATNWFTTLVAEGKVKAVIDKSIAFDDLLEGFDLVASKRTRGRVVVKVADD